MTDGTDVNGAPDLLEGGARRLGRRGRLALGAVLALLCLLVAAVWWAGRPGPPPSPAEAFVRGGRSGAEVDPTTHRYAVTWTIRNTSSEVLRVDSITATATSGRIELVGTFPTEDYSRILELPFRPKPAPQVAPGGTLGVLVRVAADCAATDRSVRLTITYRAEGATARAQDLVPPRDWGGEDTVVGSARAACATP